MRLSVDEFSLVGAGRDVQLSPGLNVIVGPIASGKTTALEICRGLVGGTLDPALPEVQATTEAISGTISINDDHFSVLRKWVTTASATVDVLGASVSERMPASQPTSRNGPTFSRWLMERLGLPIIEVPKAPSQVESDPTPVTINDYFLYCFIGQDEIDSSVFGHRNPFKNIKRKYVFEMIYGLYGIEIARLQESLREVSSKIHALQNEETVLARVLTQTPWESRSLLQAELATAVGRVTELSQEATRIAAEARQPSSVQSAQMAVLEIDRRAAILHDELTRAEAARIRLVELRGQLTTQRNRLIRSIVAEDTLVDFEFRICPRCGSELSPDRADPRTCVLCRQIAPPLSVSRRDLLTEQDRLEEQLQETEELIRSHELRVRRMGEEIAEATGARRALAARLDAVTSDYVSDAAEEIASNAAARATAEERVQRLRDYLRLFDRLDTTREAIGGLLDERRSLQGQLEAEESRAGHSRDRIQLLDEKFRAILSRLHAPEIGDPGISYIDRQTYMPVVGGRTFDNLSSQGLKVLVNVAHILAHHETCIELGLVLPSIIVIDGPTSNIGREGDDLLRVESIYEYLIDVHTRYGERLQIIVADNDIPTEAEPFLRLRLTDDDRLVPRQALIAAGLVV